MKQIVMRLIITWIVTLSIPAFGAGFSTMTSADLKLLIDRNEPGLVIVDSRTRGQYNEAHIKRAISIQLIDLEQNPDLPKGPKDAILVFYCSGNT